MQIKRKEEATMRAVRRLLVLLAAADHAKSIEKIQAMPFDGITIRTNCC